MAHIANRADDEPLWRPLPDIQRQAGDSADSPVTEKHYIHIYTESVRQAAMTFHKKLHEKIDSEIDNLPDFVF